MRVKQTARKSTASRPSHGPSSQRVGWPVALKREPGTPASSVTTSGAPTSSPAYSSKFGPSQKFVTTRDSDHGSLDRSAGSNFNPMQSRLSSLLQTKRSQADISSSSHQFAPRHKKNLDKVKFKPRSRVGEQALREIHALQKITDLLIPRSAFSRVVREITNDLMKLRPAEEQQIRYQTAALEALQEAAESHLVQLFEDSYMCTIHAKRVTLFATDMQLVRRLQCNRGLY